MLIFVCNFLVTQLSSIVGTSGNAIPARTIHLAQVPRALALSCDHSMLAVNYDLNGSTFVSVFSVPSFLSNVRFYFVI